MQQLLGYIAFQLAGAKQEEIQAASARFKRQDMCPFREAVHKQHIFSEAENLGKDSHLAL